MATPNGGRQQRNARGQFAQPDGGALHNAVPSSPSFTSTQQASHASAVRSGPSPSRSAAQASGARPRVFAPGPSPSRSAVQGSGTRLFASGPSPSGSAAQGSGARQFTSQASASSSEHTSARFLATDDQASSAGNPRGASIDTGPSAASGPSSSNPSAGEDSSGNGLAHQVLTSARLLATDDQASSAGGPEGAAPYQGLIVCHFDPRKCRPGGLLRLVDSVHSRQD